MSSDAFNAIHNFDVIEIRIHRALRIGLKRWIQRERIANQNTPFTLPVISTYPPTISSKETTSAQLLRSR